MIYKIQHISKQTEVISMQKSKLIRSFCLLLALIVGLMPSIASAQTPAMSTNIIPLIQRDALTNPYCDGNYHSASYTLPDDYETNDPELCSNVPALTTIPANVVDWILVELRAVAHGGTPGSTNPGSAVGSTVIARKPGLLLNNGRIVEASTYTGADPAACTALTMSDNCPDVEFSEGDVASAAADNDLYVVIRHRNHLDIISASRITENDEEAGVYAYDFTVANSGSSFSDNRGEYAMRSGDTNGDGTIETDDYERDVLPNIISTTVYQYGDTTMEGTIDSDDYERAMLLNIISTTSVPE